jgi:integrase
MLEPMKVKKRHLVEGGKYVRIGHGKRYRMRSKPDTAEYDAEYHQAVAALLSGAPIAKPLPLADRKYSVGSVGFYIAQYKATTQWTNCSPEYRTSRGRIFDTIAENNGHLPLKALNRNWLNECFRSRAETPSAANTFVKTVSIIFNHAISQGYEGTNPAQGFKKNAQIGDGITPWTIEKVNRFREYWALGTMPRMALELILNTGLRRGNLVNVQRNHLIDGKIKFRTTKTDIDISVPLLDECLTAISAMNATYMTFIHGERGNRYTAQSFGNMFHKWALAAGLEDFSPHGGRKLTAVLLAEAGATDIQIAAACGWTSLKMVQLYTKSANRERLSAAGFEHLRNKKSLTFDPVGEKAQKKQ